MTQSSGMPNRVWLSMLFLWCVAPQAANASCDEPWTKDVEDLVSTPGATNPNFLMAEDLEVSGVGNQACGLELTAWPRNLLYKS